MMKIAVLALIVGFASGTETLAAKRSEAKVEAAANPIRRVVTLLQNMQKKVEAEGETEKELHEKFLCYCKNGAETLAKSIEDAETKMPQLTSSIKEAVSEQSQLNSDIIDHKSDRVDAKAAMAKATEIREKEAAAFAAEKANDDANLESLKKALVAIEKGMSGGFLQTTAGAVLRRLAVSEEMSNNDRDTLTAFLTQSNGANYAPASGEIVGILKQMGDTMAKDIEDLVAQEEAAKKEYDDLMACKQKEVEALTLAIEQKIKRVGEVGIEIVNLKEDLDDTTKSYDEDLKMEADLKTDCETKAKEFEAAVKLRQEELLAIADTIKILNDDDALDIFKKALPSASFLQLEVSTKQVQDQALRVLAGLRKNGKRNMNLDLIAFALRGKKVDFNKVVAMIDDMVVLLGKEQVDDDTKKAYCEKEFDTADDKKKALERSISDIEKTLAEDAEAVKTIADEIKALEEGILKMDRSVAGATMQRKEEHEVFAATLAGNNAAMQLIEFAKNRMNKFYNPKLALSQTGALGQYKKDTEGGNGVIAMMDGLKGELAKEIQEMEFNENDSQEEYEQMVKDAADKRAADSASIEEKTAVKAGLEDDITKNTDHNDAQKAELMATKQYISELHADCDWLISNYGSRKEARANEIDALKKAKAVLSGADFSLVQTGRKTAVHEHF